MPSRVIREGWIESTAINGLSAHAERFFLRLCLKADDFGRYIGDPTLLRSNLFPLVNTRTAEIVRWLQECERADLIRCYTIKQKDYIEIPKFKQRLREMRSKFPNRYGRYDKRSVKPGYSTPSDDGRVSYTGPPETETESERKPNPKPMRLNDADTSLTIEPPSANGTVTRSSLIRSREKELMGELRRVLGEDEMARCGGHWRSDHVRRHPDLVSRALCEVDRMKKEGIPFTENAAACVEDLIKRWK